MTRPRMIAASAVAIVAAAAVVALLVRRPRASSAAESEHAKGIDYRMAPALALFRAPDGGTPCETSYNGFVAFDQAAKERGDPTPWTSLPDKSTYLARCNALTEQEQLCFEARYSAQHAATCAPITDKLGDRSPMHGFMPDKPPVPTMR